MPTSGLRARRYATPDEGHMENATASAPPPASSPLWRSMFGVQDAAARCERTSKGAGLTCYFKTCCGRWRWIASEVGTSLRRISVGVGNDFALTMDSECNVDASKALRHLGREFNEERYRTNLRGIRAWMDTTSSRLLGFAVLASLMDSSCSLHHRGTSIAFHAQRTTGKRNFEVNATLHRGSAPSWGLVYWAKADDVRMFLPWDHSGAPDEDECADVRRALFTAWRFIADADTSHLAGYLHSAQHLEQLRKVIFSQAMGEDAGDIEEGTGIRRRPVPEAAGVAEVAEIAAAALLSYSTSGPPVHPGCSVATRWSEFSDETSISVLTMGGMSKAPSHHSFGSAGGGVTGLGSHVSLDRGMASMGIGRGSLETLGGDSGVWGSSTNLAEAAW